MSSSSSNPKRRPSERSRDRDRLIEACFKTALPQTRLTVKSQIKSLLFYQPIVNQEYIENEDRRGVRDILLLNFLQWVVVIVIGTAAGISCSIVKIIVNEIKKYNTDALTNLVGESTSSNWNLQKYLFAYTLIPTIIATILVVFVEPLAEGCGTESIIAFLNGVEIPKYGSMMAIMVKYVSTVLLSLGNLPGGTEEPLIHVMSMFGTMLAKLQIPFTEIRPFLNEIHQRDFAAIGCGAGVSAVFGTPIGGTLFALELLSYWSPIVIFFIFISSLWAATVSKIILLTYKGEISSSAFVQELYIAKTSDEDVYFSVGEFPIYLLMGVIIGFAGAALNYAHIYTNAFRAFYRKRTRRFSKLLTVSECIIFAIIIALSTNSLIVSRLTACVPLFHNNKKNRKDICSDPANNIATFLCQSRNHLMNSLLVTKQEYFDAHLLLLLILLYDSALIQLGMYIPTGIIVPTLISGAIMGRLFAAVVQYLYPYSDSWARLDKMTYIGAVAHCSGLTHLKFSLGVIMIESLGNPMFGIPIMITIFITNWIVSFFSYPIYQLLMNFKGYPTLDPEQIPVVTDLTAKDIMKTPVVCLPMTIEANKLNAFLNTDIHSGYPIINAQSITEVGEANRIIIIGYIYRKHVIKLLNSYEADKSESKSASRRISFLPLMDPYPIRIKRSTSLERAYHLFYSLGLLQLLVVDHGNHLIGIITRYDLTTIRCDMTFCASRVTRGIVEID